MKLAAKLILIFMLGVFAIVSLFAWQTIRDQRIREKQQREAHANDLVSALRPALESAYHDGGTVTIQKAVEYSSRQMTQTPMRWVDGHEIPFTGSSPRSRDRGPAASSDQSSGRQPGRRSTGTEVTSRTITSVSITHKDGTRTAYSYVPLRINGDDAGAVEVAQTLADQDAHARQSMVASIISLLGVAGLSAIVIYCGGVQLVAKPLSKLIEQVNTIGTGNLAQPPAITSNDELGRLAKAISQMSHRLSEQQETIRHTDRLGTIGTLAAGMAHELGTPLNVVSGRAGLIASGKLSPDEVQSSANTIRQETDRMTTIIRQLLDFARQAPAASESIDLAQVTRGTCDMMSSLAKKSSVSVIPKIDDESVFMRGDTNQILQVLTNLIANAIQAMPDGGEVLVELSQSDDQAHLVVTDKGAGIAQENIGKLFEPFFTTKDVGQGTGLGLSIAYGIVREHGGEIKVDSELGCGSRFCVTLPCIESSTDSHQDQTTPETAV